MQESFGEITVHYVMKQIAAMKTREDVEAVNGLVKHLRDTLGKNDQRYKAAFEEYRDVSLPIREADGEFEFAIPRCKKIMDRLEEDLEGLEDPQEIIDTLETARKAFFAFDSYCVDWKKYNTLSKKHHPKYQKKATKPLKLIDEAM